MTHIRRRKLKRGTAHEVYFCIDGQPHSKYFPPEIPFQAVKDYAAKIEHNKAFARAGVEHPKAVLPLSHLARLYAEGRAAEIDPWREMIAMGILTRILGDIIAERCDHKALHQFRDKLLAERKPDDPPYEIEQRVIRGVNKELRIIRTVFLWGFKNELISSKPFDKVTFFREDDNIPDVLTREEVQLIYRNLPHRGPSRLIWYFMRFTGRRRSEILRLRRKDIDLDAGTMHIAKTKNRRPSTLVMHPKLARVLRWTLPDLPEDEVLFKIRPLSLTRNFRRAMVKAGVDKRMPSHILRHTFGARMIERYFLTGDGERLAQESLGHKSRVMTRHYTQIAKERLGSAVADVDL